MTASEQSRADAMADAETLGRVCWDYDRSKTSRYVIEAGNFGYRTLDAIYARNRGVAGSFEIAAIGARYAAHAAFRAVPGLRGE